MKKKMISMCLATALALSCTISSYASTPAFSRSAEDWAALQDNNLEYNEIGGLIEEYNATVQQNQISYNKFRSDYGDTNDEVSRAYRDLADELQDSISYPDTDDANYASSMIGILGMESQIKQLETSADNNLEDSETMRLNYEMAKMGLIQTAQTNMITYKNALLDIDKAEMNKNMSKISLDAVSAQASVGLATQIDVLTAQETYLNSDQAITTAKSSADSTKQKLLIMCGWAYNADAVIGNVPEPDLARIDTINPENDKAEAIENNYTLKINLKKLSNSTAQSDIDTLNSTIADNKQKIATSLTTSYNNIIAARNAYIYAQTNASLQNTNLATASQRYGLGLASKIDYDTQSVTTQSANIAFEQAKLNLFQAIQAYDWCVAGMASAS